MATVATILRRWAAGSRSPHRLARNLYHALPPQPGSVIQHPDAGAILQPRGNSISPCSSRDGLIPPTLQLTAPGTARRPSATPQSPPRAIHRTEPVTRPISQARMQYYPTPPGVAEAIAHALTRSAPGLIRPSTRLRRGHALCLASTGLGDPLDRYGLNSTSNREIARTKLTRTPPHDIRTTRVANAAFGSAFSIRPTIMTSRPHPTRPPNASSSTSSSQPPVPRAGRRPGLPHLRPPPRPAHHEPPRLPAGADPGLPVPPEEYARFRQIVLLGPASPSPAGRMPRGPCGIAPEHPRDWSLDLGGLGLRSQRTICRNRRTPPGGTETWIRSAGRREARDALAEAAVGDEVDQDAGRPRYGGWPEKWSSRRWRPRRVRP